MNILVINLTRFGDLLQSQAALTGLAARGDRVGLVCLDNFQRTAGMLRHVDALFPLNGASLLAALERDWPGALAGLDGWARETLAAFRPDSVLNVTPTVSARLLGRFLARAEDGSPLPYDGFALDESGFGVNGNAWAAFMQGASRVRGVSPFNVADLFRKVANAGDGPPDPSLAPPPPAARDTAKRLLGIPENGERFVALQPGASEERRRWPAAHFAQLGEILWREEGLRPVLLGSAGERTLAEDVASRMDAPALNLAGQTSLEELSAVLLECRLLVSNDTGTLHLAAGLDRPVLGIFLATAQPWDTGPYRAGNCSLEPDLECHPCAFGKACPREEACREAISADGAARIALHRLRHGAWRGHAPAPGIRVWESVLEEDGLMGLVSLSGHDEADRTRWMREQRCFYSQFLDRDRSADFTPRAPDEPLRLSALMAEEVRRDLTVALALLDALIQQGELLLLRPLAQIKERFFASFTRLGALLGESPRLAALRLLWMEETSGSDELPRVLRLAGQYRNLMAAMLERLG